MAIIYDQAAETFHLHNQAVSYIMKVLPNRQIGQLYFGKPVPEHGNYDYLLEPAYRPMTSYVFEGDHSFSLEHVRQEYPSYGTGDYRDPAIGIQDGRGSRISDYVYENHQITEGKPRLEGLPATYCEDAQEAETLHLFLKDPVTETQVELLYTLFDEIGVLARSVRIRNQGEVPVMITRAMSLCLDLPDDDYDWMQFSGAWARERHPVNRRLVPGIQSVGSIRGNSSHMQNPFVILKRPYTTESTGEAIGFSLLYSGSFLAQAEVDPWGVTRILMGIHPLNFNWKLEKEETLQLPEVVMVYSDNGLNDLSHTFHNLFRRRLARGYWRDRPRPILLNSWECMKFDITQEKITRLTNLAKESGIELIVLDDGWFADRVSDQKGLGDWGKDRDVFPGGIRALAKMIRDAGLAFGLWIEPEMVNRDSDLFQDHPDWILRDPNRRLTHGRNEFVLDLSRKEVVDYLFQTLSDRFREADVMYVKWDMNRSMTEAYSISLPPDRQGEVMHRYLMGVYALYERLLSAFPKVLFESCASGGGRFDAGMLFYAPQCWISDDSDAIERIAIQYGSSYGYPLSTFGAHISASPNEQVYRCTPLHTRGNVALFGCFGYELDLGTLSEEELLQIREQVVLAKTCRDVVQNGSFYRLISPFDNRNLAAWMVVNQKQDMALVGWYKILNEVNGPYHRIQLQGLKEDAGYQIWQTDERSRLVPYCAYRASAGILQTEYPQIYSGAELMRIGLVTTDSAAGEWRDGLKKTGDFDSRVYVLYEVTGFTYKKQLSS